MSMQPKYSPLNVLCLQNIPSEGYYLRTCSFLMESLGKGMNAIGPFVCLTLSLVLVKRRALTCGMM